MSSADGHDPPQVPHWMHIERREFPGVANSTCSVKLRGAVSSDWLKEHLLLICDCDMCECESNKETLRLARVY